MTSSDKSALGAHAAHISWALRVIAWMAVCYGIGFLVGAATLIFVLVSS